MPEARRQRDRLIAVFFLGVILLNYPLLALFSTEKLVLGVPVLYLSLFVIWFALIAGIACILERTGLPASLARSHKPGNLE